MKDISRTVVVYGRRPGLWSRLATKAMPLYDQRGAAGDARGGAPDSSTTDDRARLDPLYAETRYASPATLMEVIDTTMGHPWAVIGDDSEFPAELASLCAENPVLVFWIYEQPAGLPAHAFRHSDVDALVDDVNRRLHKRVGPLRLGPGWGLLLDDELVKAPELEALLGLHPAPIALARHRVSHARRVLARRHLPWSVVSREGLTHLVPQEVA